MRGGRLLLFCNEGYDVMVGTQHSTTGVDFRMLVGVFLEMGES